MKTRQTIDPKDYAPEDVLAFIENDPQSFTPGRRNNDMVNWFIIKRVIELGHYTGGGISTYDIAKRSVADFKEMMARLTGYQDQMLRSWDTDWTHKMQILVDHYAGYQDIKYLYYLWLPMDYEVSTEQENQLQLMTKG